MVECAPFTNSNAAASDHRSLSLLLLQGPIPLPHLRQIHGRVFRSSAHQDNLIATLLIGRYPTPLLSLRLLRLLRSPNIFPFNAAIRVLAQSRLHSPAFSLFNSLNLLSLSPNVFTFSFLLKACLSPSPSLLVNQVHTHVLRSGLASDPFVANGLLSAYTGAGKGGLASARILFDEIPNHKRTACLWTCLIAAYARSRRHEEALMLFSRMVRENLTPADDTMVSVLSACSNLDIGEVGKWVSVFEEFSANDEVGAVVIYLYAKWGKVERSREVFDKVMGVGGGRRRRVSVVIWNAMIGGYVRNGEPVDALDLFRRMLADSRPEPNHVTIVSVLSACALVGDLDLGRWAHAYVKSNGSKRVVETNKILATAFIDMYTKCGSLKEAKEVFYAMKDRDVVSYNAMIMGLAIHSQAGEAMGLFSEMEKIRIRPNDGTFLGLLCACTHSGLVEEGRRFFRLMGTPKIEHYACFIDLLARANHVEEALGVVETMPIEPNGLVWGALLGACLVNFRMDVARVVARKLFDVDPESSGGYVMLSNAYAVHQGWGDVAGLRGLMKAKGVRKHPGCSWIGIEGVTHEFRVGSLSHPEIQNMLHLLDSLYRQIRLVGR